MKAVIKHLTNLGIGKPPVDTTEGVCVELRTQFGPDVMEYVMGFIPEWNRHSGNELFPVPSPSGKCPSEEFNHTVNLWVGDYGDLRRDLCRFLVRRLEQEASTDE